MECQEPRASQGQVHLGAGTEMAVNAERQARALPLSVGIFFLEPINTIGVGSLRGAPLSSAPRGWGMAQAYTLEEVAEHRADCWIIIDGQDSPDGTARVFGEEDRAGTRSTGRGRSRSLASGPTPRGLQASLPFQPSLPQPASPRASPGASPGAGLQSSHRGTHANARVATLAQSQFTSRERGLRCLLSIHDLNEARSHTEGAPEEYPGQDWG